MKTEEFDSLFLNMLDLLEITMKNFYYKITEKGEIKSIDYGYNKSTEEGWILCNDLYGQYCGENYKQNGELNIIKVRILHPFKMSKDYHSYLSLDPSAIVSMVSVLRQKTSAMDEISHILASGEKIEFNLNLGIN